MLGLRGLLYQAVQLRGGGLVDAGFLFQPQQPHCLQDAQGAQAVHVRGVFRLLEAYGHVALRPQVVNLVRLHLLDDAGDVAGGAQVA